VTVPERLADPDPSRAPGSRAGQAPNCQVTARNSADSTGPAIAGYTPIKTEWIVIQPVRLHGGAPGERGIDTLAAVLEAPGKDFVVETVQLAAPGPPRCSFA